MTEPSVPVPPPISPPPLVPPPPSPAGHKTGMLVLAYLGLLALIPLLTEKDDREVQWHAKHGLVFLVAYLILGAAITVMSFVIGLASLLWGLAWIAYLIVTIIAIVKAVNGQRFLVPGLSEFADKF